MGSEAPGETKEAPARASSLSERASRVSLAMAMPATSATVTTGYLAKKGEYSNILTGNKWKRRWFVLEAGELTYYTEKSTWERGEKPLKGHRISVASMVLWLDEHGADISLQPKEGADRTWQFICDSNTDIERWSMALQSQGAVLSTTAGKG
jgi:hypothetical protein